MRLVIVACVIAAIGCGGPSAAARGQHDPLERTLLLRQEPGAGRLVRPAAGLAQEPVGRLGGLVVGDVVVTPEEVAGLMQNLLVTDSSPAGRTALSQWILQHRESLGHRYSSELARRRDRSKSYDELRVAS